MKKRKKPHKGGREKGVSQTRPLGKPPHTEKGCTHHVECIIILLYKARNVKRKGAQKCKNLEKISLCRAGGA